MKLIRWAGENVTPSDDAKLSRRLYADGLFASVTPTHTSGTVTIPALYGMMCGRDFTTDEETLDAILATSGTITGQIYMYIDTEDATYPLDLKIRNSVSALPTNDINADGTTYGIEIAQYTANTSEVTGVTFTAKINNVYGGKIADNLDTITQSGFYTCYGTATGVPNASSSWYVIHTNSNVGTVSAWQMAKSYTTGEFYFRNKSTTWGAWEIKPSTNGWNFANETWEYVSVDDPTGVIRVNADVTTKYCVGMKIIFTNGGNIIYGFITAIGAYSGGYTNITFLHEIDPTDSLALHLMANSAITANYYSNAKAPFGFPLNLDKWSVIITNTNTYSQASPTTNYYNIGSLSLVLPIGAWNMTGHANIRIDGTGDIEINVALSTSVSEVTDEALKEYIYDTTPVTLIYISQKNISITSKTTYYLIERKLSGTVSTIYVMGAASGTVLKAVCTYL